MHYLSLTDSLPLCSLKALQSRVQQSTNQQQPEIVILVLITLTSSQVSVNRAAIDVWMAEGDKRELGVCPPGLGRSAANPDGTQLSCGNTRYTIHNTLYRIQTIHQPSECIKQMQMLLQN
jgi:hypothetical protein